jgi:hypothetical protein
MTENSGLGRACLPVINVVLHHHRAGINHLNNPSSDVKNLTSRNQPSKIAQHHIGIHHQAESGSRAQSF